ncbi:MAG TPA: KTSC domain-containing protein [Longimicrobium sp.]|nr:KTSC domain-containing protein [Longimicrobium sp.]
MERARVDSSSIASIGYDPATRTLEVEFVNGGLYHYLDVPVEELERFVTSGSLGRYLNQHIKPSFEVRRVDRGDEE